MPENDEILKFVLSQQGFFSSQIFIAGIDSHLDTSIPTPKTRPNISQFKAEKSTSRRFWNR